MRHTRRPASVSNAEFVAGLRLERFSHPGRDAARAVAADFSDGAVGVVQANAAGFLPRPGEELDAVSTDAGVARRKAGA